MTVKIIRRAGEDYQQVEKVAEYHEGELRGWPELVEGYQWLEGESEEEVLRTFRGFKYDAVEMDEDDHLGRFPDPDWEPENPEYLDPDYDGDSDGGEEVAEKMAEAVLKEWSGPHEGPRGGTYWENDEGERRYQENKPSTGGSGGDDSGDGGEATPAEDRGSDEATEAVEVEDGVYGEVVEVNPFDKESWPDDGEEVLIDGKTFEAVSGGPLMGPDGEHYMEIQYGNGTMHVRWDSVEGKLAEKYEVGDYDIETEWGMKFADSVNSGDWGERGADGFMGVRDIQHHASNVDNPQLLADAIVQEKDGRNSVHAKKAMEGRIRALGHDPRDLLPAEREGALFDPSEYDAFKERYSPDAVVEENRLWDEDDVEQGINSNGMFVQRLEDGTRVFKTQFKGSDVVNEKHRDEIIVTGEFLRNIGLEGAVTPIDWDQENGAWTVSESFGDEDTPAVEVSNLRDLPEARENADPEQGFEVFSKAALAGMGDLHGDNVRMDSEGNFGLFDLDHSIYGVRDHHSPEDKIRRGALTYLKGVREKEYSELPDRVQDRIPQVEWDNTHPTKRHREFPTEVQVAMGERANEVALELVEEHGEDLEGLLPETDDGYFNRQDRYKDALRELVQRGAEKARDNQ